MKPLAQELELKKFSKKIYQVLVKIIFSFKNYQHKYKQQWSRGIELGW